MTQALLKPSRPSQTIGTPSDTSETLHNKKSLRGLRRLLTPLQTLRRVFTNKKSLHDAAGQPSRMLAPRISALSFELLSHASEASQHSPKAPKAPRAPS